MVVNTINPTFAHPFTHIWGHKTNNGAIVVAQKKTIYHYES
jgi:hypothetical protein